jgi:hypothetical protein
MEPEEADIDNEDEDEDEDEDMPELLPEDLLDTEFTRAPTPPLVTAATAKPTTKNRIIRLDGEAPQDRKVGPITVSVLPKSNMLLPPKSSVESKKLREHWLAGKRKGQGKAKGMATAERKPFGGGFVKR